MLHAKNYEYLFRFLQVIADQVADTLLIHGAKLQLRCITN